MDFNIDLPKELVCNTQCALCMLKMVKCEKRKVHLGQETLDKSIFNHNGDINGEELQRESESTNITVGSISCYTAQLR